MKPRRTAAFSLAELLVAAVIAAGVITTAVLVYQNLNAARAPRSAYGTVEVGSALATFFGGTDTALDVYFAPSYGRAAQAEMVRTQFVNDLQRAVAVFCLGREEPNTVRPSTIAVGAGFQGNLVDTPEAFRALLASAIPASAAIFTAYRGACAATNASIFLLAPAADATALAVLAVYDIDLTPTTSPAGTYASVKRYEAGALTDYYDVFYPASSGAIPFRPLVVAFERAVRAVAVEGDPIDRYKKAAAQPFYFVWWPDPTVPALEAISAPTYDASDPRAGYPAMGGRTAFFFVVPMFPAL